MLNDVLLSIINMCGAGIETINKQKEGTKEQIIFSAGCCLNGIIGVCMGALEQAKELPREQSHD